MSLGARDRAALALSFVACVLLLWVGTSVARGKGLVLFAGSLGALGLALALFLRGRRTPLYAVYFLTVLLVTPILVAELALRTSRGLLRGRVGNYVHGGYHDEPEGIYTLDPYLGRAMRPGVSRRMYWNGHWWRHEANARGYRGPLLETAAAVFLGDSLVYGHGVESADTVAAQYAGLSGAPAANLGLQGACPVQALHLLRTTGLPLRPQVVFACLHPNDVADAAFWYEPEELRKFLADSGSQPYEPRVRRELRDPKRSVYDWWLLHAAVPMRTGRLFRAAARQGAGSADGRGGARQEESEARSGGPWRPRPEALSEPLAPSGPGAPDEARLGWEATRHAIERMRGVCGEAGVRLVLFDLGYPYAFTAAVEDLARSLGVPYSPAGRVALERAEAGEAIYLTDDGHWSPFGSRVVAGELVKAGPRPRPGGDPAGKTR